MLTITPYQLIEIHLNQRYTYEEIALGSAQIPGETSPLVILRLYSKAHGGVHCQLKCRRNLPKDGRDWVFEFLS